MPATVCPFCKSRTNLTYVEGTAGLLQDELRLEGVFQCDNEKCRRLVIGGTMRPMDFQFIQPGDDASARASLVRTPDADMYWEPKNPVARKFPDVPGQIAEAASEAHSCASIGAHRAAIILARAVIEAVAKAHEISKGSLYDKIEALGEKNKLRPVTVDTAHEIRHLGNDMAHGDFGDEPIDAEDAADALDFLDVVLDDVYQSEAKLNRRRDARLAKKALAGSQTPPVDAFDGDAPSGRFASPGSSDTLNL